MAKSKLEVNWEAVQLINDHRISKEERDVRIDFNIARANSDLQSAKLKNALSNLVLFTECGFIGTEIYLASTGHDIVNSSLVIPALTTAFLVSSFTKMKLEAKDEIKFYKKEKRYFEQLKKIYEDCDYDAEKIQQPVDKVKTLKLNSNYKGHLYGNIEK